MFYATHTLGTTALSYANSSLLAEKFNKIDVINLLIFYLDVLEVLKSPYQPTVEYEQADVSTADFNKIFLIFIIRKFLNIFI
ncbi:hypothetical protein T11_2513 [Trichinella zimbabwensis]|uniref:Uncharacterized protein n=1 Tax=Trichinella zimbabwensis TaxID=268475 RepID=A0A0V1H9Y6_9BILA|nr:hypothetical protein T11_2513 [Trichinella zimbabwensis]